MSHHVRNRRSQEEVDVFDAGGQKIGLIEGTLFTLTMAKYNLYDQYNTLVAHAYLDFHCSAFTIMSHGEKTIARLKRKFIVNDKDSWKIDLYDSSILDPRILKIFAALAIDFQGYFKEDR